MIYFAIEKGDEDYKYYKYIILHNIINIINIIWSTLLLRKGMKIAETTLSMPQSRFSVSEAAMFTKWKEFFFHILTDRNLSLFCAYFDSRQTAQFSSLLLYFDTGWYR